MHHKIVNKITPSQSQAAQSAKEAASLPPTAPSKKKTIVHYTNEKRFRSFKRDAHAVDENVFKEYASHRASTSC